MCEKNKLFNKAVEDEGERQEFYKACKRKDLERILTIDLQLGYIKGDDRDRVDYFNSLPTACKLSFYNEFIKKKIDNTSPSRVPRVSEENMLSLSKRLKFRQDIQPK